MDNAEDHVGVVDVRYGARVLWFFLRLLCVPVLPVSRRGMEVQSWMNQPTANSFIGAYSEVMELITATLGCGAGKVML